LRNAFDRHGGATDDASGGFHAHATQVGYSRFSRSVRFLLGLR
jgi:hypothetical protein